MTGLSFKLTMMAQSGALILNPCNVSCANKLNLRVSKQGNGI